MPRRAQAKAAAGAAAAGPEAALALNVEDPAADPEGCNVAWHVQMEGWISVLTDHRLFRDIMEAAALKIGDDTDLCGKPGYKDDFTGVKMRNALQSTGRAELSGNFFWQDWRYSTMPGVPVNKKAVLDLRDRDFAAPVAFPERIAIAAPSAQWLAEIVFGALRLRNSSRLHKRTTVS